MSTIGDHNIEIGADISGFERAMRQMQDSLEEVGKKMQEVGEVLTKAITVPLTGLGIAAVGMAVDSDKALGRLQAGLGMTADEAKNLHQIAKDVWERGFGESVEEAANSVAKVKQNLNGLEASDEVIGNLTNQAYILSDAFGVEVGESTKTAATIMRNFGMDGREAMDLIAVGFQKGGDFSGELLDTLNEYSPQFSQMGISAQDMLGILIEGTKAG